MHDFKSRYFLFHCSRIYGGVYINTHIKWLIEISRRKQSSTSINTETLETINNNIQIHIN
ncbi:hypothetical protein [Enterobacter phage vB_EclS_AS5]